MNNDSSNKLHDNPHLELPPEHSPAERSAQANAHTFPSMYSKIPYQDEPPSYDATTSGSITTYPSSIIMPQPEAYQQQPSYPPPPGPPPSLMPAHQPCYHHNNSYPQLPQSTNQSNGQVVTYGSVAAPNTTAVFEPLTSLKTKSKLVQCPHCQQIGYTKLAHDCGACTGVSVASLFCLGCSPLTFIVPFVFPWFQDVVHKCPSCNEEIAKFSRLERQLSIYAPTALP